ncbi:MAG: TIM barrel protein [Peptococcaceae bacterium]|nr:TIM barrel protein [Peptococcaceae bacterium]
MSLKFGTAGVPLSAKEGSTEAGVRRVRELGLDAMEVEFVHGVRMREEKAFLVRKVAEETQVSLSCHAPYYINLNSNEEEKVIASKTRIVQTAQIAECLGAGSIVFHPAFYSENSSDAVLKKVVKELSDVREELDQKGNKVILRPETTGKPTQFGDLEETIQISKEILGVLPCIDFSHLHARSNGLYNSYDEFCSILDKAAEGLGQVWVENAHFHISGIEYGPKGEKKHLILQEADFKAEQLIKAIISFGISGTVICESPNLEGDTLTLQKIYQGLIV